MNNLATLVGRIGLSLIFILAGLDKLGAGYGATQGYMEAMGVPGALLPLVIAVEILGGLAIAVGLLTRWAAVGLAAFSVATAVLFHFAPGDQAQFINFMKNLAIAGGFLVLAAHGAGTLSVDGWLQARRTQGFGGRGATGGAR